MLGRIRRWHVMILIAVVLGVLCIVAAAKLRATPKYDRIVEGMTTLAEATGTDWHIIPRQGAGLVVLEWDEGRLETAMRRDGQRVCSHAEANRAARPLPAAARPLSHGCPLIRAAISGVIFSVPCQRQKLCAAKTRAALRCPCGHKSRTVPSIALS